MECGRNVHEHGFGNIAGEYWIGLIKMHHLTASALQKIRIDLEDFQGNKCYMHVTVLSLCIMQLHSIT